MQKTKTVKVGKQDFLVRELPVRTIWELINNPGKEEGIDRAKKLMQLGCPDLTEESMLDMYSAFLGMVRRIGLDQALIQAVRGAVMGSIAPFVSSSDLDMAH